MDFVRKFVTRTSSIQQQPPQSNSLGLLTLRRQFRDVCFTTRPLTVSETEDKLYTILPLFLQVFKSLPPHDMKEKFGDVLQFSTRVSGLMVTEIRRRASNKSTEQASVDIANFLALKDGASKGWTLLNVLSLLAAGDQSIIDCMTTTHLPSTLVKCLYLFFDLPPHDSDRSYTVSVQAKEMLQKTFVQTLVRLCGYISPAEELSRKDDLALLFSAVTSWCSPHNKNWRTAASDVLITISRHGLSHHVVQYIRSKHCIKTCINNLWRATVSVGENSSTFLDIDLADQLLCVMRFINNTAQVSQLLLDDFRQHQGYIFIGEFVLRLENVALQNEQYKKALLSVVGSIDKLTTCGFNELVPDPVVHQSFQTNFTVPQPIGKGESVRNIHAFELLETCFVRCRTTLLARAVLDAVFAVYCRDPANYFILFSLNTMSNFSERLAMKDPELYSQYFAIFEYISLTLGFIPRRELISISLLLKTDSNVECSIACLKSLQKLLSSNLNSYKEVFREVGLFEMLIKCLQRYSSMLKAVDVSDQTINNDQHEFGRLTMDVLVEMVQISPTNAGIFRETGGARCAYNTLSYPACRRSALSLVEALILQPANDGNDDDMATILGLLSTLNADEIQLKIDMLKSVYKVVSKSDVASVMFRNVGGILSLISVLLSMEGYMSFEPPPLWSDNASDGYILLETTFHVLTVVLKLPLNEKYFEHEIGYEAVFKACLHFGCFSPTPVSNSCSPPDSSRPIYLQDDIRDQDFPATSDTNKESFLARKILCFFKLLYMAACDLFKDEVQTKIEKLEHSTSKYSNLSDDSPRKFHEFPRGLVLHPNFFKLYLHLVSCLHVEGVNEQVLVSLQLYLLEEFISVLNSERNEQIVCEVGLLSTLLSSFENVLTREDQALNLACQKTLERLATQSVSPQELRMLLRVGNPLHCENLFLNNGVVALNRVKSLVSVATPRNVGMISDISSTYKAPPSFIEFDMTIQGNSHVFIPFIFPQSTSIPTSTGASVSTERIFPPAHSLAISLWFYVDSFCRLQVHPIRLLTIERQIISSQQGFLCFSIMISPRRHRLVISTSEFNTSNLTPGSLEFEDSKETVGFNVDHLLVEGQWHNLLVVLQRASVLKQTTVTASLNGNILGVSKIRYINQCPGGNSQQSLNSPIAVHAWVGTPPQLSTVSSLVWRLGSLRIFDETSSFVANISSIQTELGPNYVGNYQSILLPDGNVGAAFLEDHLCFSLLPSSVETISPGTIQRSHSNFDLKILLFKLNTNKIDDLSSFDFYPNASLHAPGPARTYGGFSIGRKYKEAPRCFLPNGVGRVLQDIGGISVSLYLVAMADDVEGLYAAVKFLVCVLKSDQRAMLDMERSNGYQALGMLLKDKKHLLNSHILHLTFSIAGTVDTDQDATAEVTNYSAFESLLSDLEIWHNAPQELHKSLFDHFYELLTGTNDVKKSHSIITDFNFMQKCMYFIYSDSSLSFITVTTIIKVILAIFSIDARKQDLLCFGRFVVTLITSSNVSEKDVVLGEAPLDFSENQTRGKIDIHVVSKRNIHFRNMLLDLTTKCILLSSKENSTFTKIFESCLGFDWILLFMQSHLHHSTVTTSLRLLFTILQCSYNVSSSNTASNLSSVALQPPSLPVYSTPLTLIDRFRSGEGFGGWLQGTDVLVEKKEDSLLGFNVRSISDFTSDRYHQSVLMQAVPVPGFLALQNLLSFHASSEPVLKLLLQFLVGQYDSSPSLPKLAQDDIHPFFKALNQPRLEENLKILSLEISQVLNSMLRQLLNQDVNDADKSTHIRDISFTLIDAFEFLYINDISDLSSMFASPEFLTSFIFALFPPEKVVSLTSGSSPKDLLSLEGLVPSSLTKLSTHSSSKSLYLFLCKVVWDSTTGVRNKSSQIIDILLEMPSDKSNAVCVARCVTNVITHVIEYCVPSLADLIKSSHCSLSISYLTSRIVDKVWQDMYRDDTKKIFDFISHLISSYHHKFSSQVLQSLYRSLYRLILYQLSRKHSTISEQMVLLDALHCLTQFRTVVFDSKFRDSSFLPCLCHCLFMVSGDSDGKDFGLEAEQRQTTWHVPEASKPSSPTAESPTENTPGLPSSSQEKAQSLLNNAAARVWNVLMSSKKDVLTEVFKMTFINLDSELASFDHAKTQIREAASKTWLNYLALERKGALGGVKESPQQQKLMKRMSNVMLGGGKKAKKEFVSKLGKNITIQDSHLWTLNHISVVQSLVRLQCNEHEQEENYLKRFTMKEWDRTTSELTRERGVWGPENEEVLTKWTLDSTEGPSRMRKRMMKDETFYVRYPHRVKSDNTIHKHKKPTSKDSLEYYRRINCLSPYYNPDNDEKTSDLINQEPSSDINTKPEVESSSDELDADDTVILNLCLKCQPSQPSADLKVNTLKGKEASSCDICGSSLDPTNANDIEPVTSQVGDAPSAKVGATNTETTESGTESSENKSKRTTTLSSESNGIPIINRPASRTEDSIDSGSPAEHGLLAKKQVNGLVPSDSLSSLTDPVQDKDKQDNQTILKLLEKGEKIRNMFRVARVQGLDVHEGLLLFGQDHYYIIDGFTMLKSKEIRDIASLPGEHEPIIPSSSRPSQDNLKNEVVFTDRMCSKFSYSDIREVHKRRYLLQNIALEVFNRDGRNCLLVFPQNTRTKVFSKFTSYSPSQSDRGKDSIVGQRSGLSIEPAAAPVWFGLIGEKTVTSRWERGEINNFQYIMYLNTLAGRSYNDLMQYPVFPWIIADYDSEVLDLSKPETFRDLSKPMGTQTQSRLEQYKKRYKDWEELGGIETPPYHYGTHYSSAMIVASYLVRMEPFTQHFLRLQGGHFDLADRMFHSIKDSWTSASQKNMADVKELIPEFFYLPEFLLNTNRFDLGQKQNGVRLDDVILPAWARGSTHEFIRAHREALECDYVSSHLHEWIDLIFGYKQKGEAAFEANNVFHHLFYEGEVDIYSIKDPLKRNATIGFINNFGQIPKQLFKRPHPQKKCKSDGSISTSDNKVFYKHIESLSTLTPIKEIQEPVGHIATHDRGVSVTEKGKLLVPPHNTRYVSWGHKDLSVRAGNYESDRPTQIFEDLGCDEITCAAMANENVLVTGNKSTVVHVWQLPTVKNKNKSLELTKCLYGHAKAVSSVAVCASYGIIVSGSEDGSCILWDLNHLVFVRQLQHHHDMSISNICINEKTGTVVTSSGTNLYQWSINGQLIACASALSSNARSQHITALSMSKLNEWDPDAVIVTGHSDGHLRFWRLEHVQVPESSHMDDVQMYADTKKNPAMQHLVATSRSPDTLSLASLGDMAELPWNDVSKVELTNQNEPRNKEETSQSKTTPVLKWKEQLVLKGKIELPVFSSKSGSSYSPPVTCIAMSKNHESLYVGDDEGRVFLWTCS